MTLSGTEIANALAQAGRRRGRTQSPLGSPHRLLEEIWVVSVFWQSNLAAYIKLDYTNPPGSASRSVHLTDCKKALYVGTEAARSTVYSSKVLATKRIPIKKEMVYGLST